MEKRSNASNTNHIEMNRRTEKGRTIMKIKDEITPNAQGNLFENTDHPEGDCESVINIHTPYKCREFKANEIEEEKTVMKRILIVRLFDVMLRLDLDPNHGYFIYASNNEWNPFIVLLLWILGWQ